MRAKLNWPCWWEKRSDWKQNANDRNDMKMQRRQSDRKLRRDWLAVIVPRQCDAFYSQQILRALAAWFSKSTAKTSSSNSLIASCGSRIDSRKWPFNAHSSNAVSADWFSQPAGVPSISRINTISRFFDKHWLKLVFGLAKCFDFSAFVYWCKKVFEHSSQQVNYKAIRPTNLKSLPRVQY